MFRPVIVKLLSKPQNKPGVVILFNKLQTEQSKSGRFYQFYHRHDEASAAAYTYIRS